MSFLLGVLFAIGVFTRITFVLFGFPLGVMFLYLNWRATVTKSRLRLASIKKFILACLPLALGIAAMSLFAIVVDSVFFEKLIIFNKSTGEPIPFLQLLDPRTWIQVGFKGTLTVSMLNNLVYNMDLSNLAEHGLHPRVLHIFLNYPVLFGNLAYFATKTMIQKLRQGEWTSQPMRYWLTLCHATSGGEVLDTLDSSTGHFTLWEDSKTWQEVLGIAHVSVGQNYTTHIVFYKTYMPPHHLFGYNSALGAERGTTLMISDWHWLTRAEFTEKLQGEPQMDQSLLLDAQKQHGQNAVVFRKNADGHFQR
ncbi:hypothetical protein BGZ94_004534 [Podila epigama]|nr:hypothetical protein BGZ94_004534 [Podila epigama]